jgi:hypothetical protein
LTTIVDERSYKSREKEKQETQQDMQTIPGLQVSFLTKLVGLRAAHMPDGTSHLRRLPESQTDFFEKEG